MLEEGALAECAAFLAAGIDRRLPAAKVLGARELFAHLEGALSLEAATEAAIAATRRYAKRQRTWLRGRMRDWTWIDPALGDPLAAVPER
jgi:tRNA dimethylallyltransferase